MAAVWTRGNKAALLAGNRCSARDCDAPKSGACAYVDQWGWGCAEVLCHGHAMELGGEPYCRRHAGLFLALGGSLALLDCEMDDHFARRPSLVSWVPRDLDLDMRNLLADVAEIPRYQATIVTTQMIHAAPPELVTWEVRWELANSSPKVNVSFMLEGYQDAAIVARVDGRMAMRESPEWLRQHLNNEAVDGATEEHLRRDQFQRLYGTMATAWIDACKRQRAVTIDLPGNPFQVMSRRDLRAS